MMKASLLFVFLFSIQTRMIESFLVIVFDGSLSTSSSSAAPRSLRTTTAFFSSTNNYNNDWNERNNNINNNGIRNNNANDEYDLNSSYDNNNNNWDTPITNDYDASKTNSDYEYYNNNNDSSEYSSTDNEYYSGTSTSTRTTTTPKNEDDAVAAWQKRTYGYGADLDNKKKMLLEGCVCLVTGASRGVGKGIAIELGKQGAIVYVTGTTTAATAATSEYSYSETDSSSYDGQTNNYYPGTIEQTAEEVTAAGGYGIPIYCDHSDDEQVANLFNIIAEEQDGRLDILVNNAFRTPTDRMEFLIRPFWEQGATGWDSIHTVGLRSHYIASCYAMPLMFNTVENNKKKLLDPSNTNRREKNCLSRPIVIMIGSFGGLTYTFNVPYGVGKAGVDRLAKDMSVELNNYKKDVAVVSLWPGVVRTEITDIALQSGEWEKYVGIPIIESNFESPQFTGKAVVALATDPDNKKMSGTYQVVAELADLYKFDDINGNRPPSVRSLKFLLPTYGGVGGNNSFVNKLIPDWKLPFWVMSQGQKPKE